MEKRSNDDKDQLLNTLNDHSLSAMELNSVGNAFRDLDKYELAEKAFLKSIELNPSYDAPYAHLISLYAKLNKFDLCEEIYQKGSKNATEKTYIMYHDGRSRFLRGDYNGSLMAARCILIDDEWQNENAILMVIESLLMLIKSKQSEDPAIDLQEAYSAWKSGLTLFPHSRELLQYFDMFDQWEKALEEN
jgi:tetratricopeptide (TPR) repeat protein